MEDWKKVNEIFASKADTAIYFTYILSSFYSISLDKYFFLIYTQIYCLGLRQGLPSRYPQINVIMKWKPVFVGFKHIYFPSFCTPKPINEQNFMINLFQFATTLVHITICPKSTQRLQMYFLKDMNPFLLNKWVDCYGTVRHQKTAVSTKFACFRNRIAALKRREGEGRIERFITL